MASLAELIAVTKEVREIEKGFSPSTATGNFSILSLSVPAATTSRFSLPSRCYYVAFVSASTSLLGCPVSSFTGAYTRLVTTANQIQPLNSWGVNAPLDLSDFSVFAVPSSSGATLIAWIQQAAPLAT
jgi:hypothetical protein